VRPGWAATPLSFQLDWKRNAQFAGLFLAEAEGLYAEAGLDVAIREWADSIRVMEAVGSGEMDMGCAEQSLILKAQAGGAPVRAVATMFQASPYGLMTLPDRPLDGLGDLLGRRVGVHDDGAAVMALVMGAAGMEPDAIEIVEVPYAEKFALVTRGEVHAVQCYVIDEPIGVAARFGVEPKLMHMRDHGLDSTAQTIVVHQDVLDGRPDAVRAFLAASFEGWTRALADKEAAARRVVEGFVPEGSPYHDVPYQVRTLELLESYVVGPEGEAAVGAIDPARWQAMAERMAEAGMIPTPPPASETLATGFWG
jgi:ABC-type nitrate/sulfonate/bicarbonate transport system substrate-binding protein